MKITKDLSPKKYKFIHYNCCEFEAEESEFKWITGQSNVFANIICPKCKERFSTNPERIYERK